MTQAELLIVEALSLCRMVPGAAAKRFVRDLCGRHKDAPLTPRQRKHLWQVARRFRRQITNPSFSEMIDKHLAALEEGEFLPHPRGDFESALSLDPEDWATRLVYADWLEDDGLTDEAAGQRWQAANRKRPLLSAAGASYQAGGTFPINWEWKWDLGCKDQSRARVNELPPAVWAPVHLAWSKTRIEAEARLAARLAQCFQMDPATPRINP